MTTDLLLENLDPTILEVLKHMCSSPETVAHHMVPRMRRLYYNANQNETLKFLTVVKIIYKMLAWQLV